MSNEAKASTAPAESHRVVSGSDGAVRDLPRLRALACRLHQDGRLAEAIAAYQAFLAARPEDAGIWSNLGVALRAQKQFQAASLCYRRALELRPHDPAILGNLGNVLKDLDQLDESIAMHRAAVARNPNDARLVFNLGLAYRDAAQFSQALEAIDRALALQPGDAHMLWDRALVLLHQGRFEEAWRDYEARWQIGDVTRPDFPGPSWQGEDLTGRSILLYPEQGFGDSILASRFIPQVKARGGAVILLCKEPLRRLFAGLAGVDLLATPDQSLPPFDRHCPLMSLPGVLRLGPDAIPAPAELSVPEDARTRARELLRPGKGRFKVGIVWSGSVTFKGNRKRAVALNRFLELAAVPGVQLYSLYKGPLESNLREFGMGALVMDLGSQVADFADTAAIIEQLDLVIMTDSAVAHLAGSLGRPVWNLLSFSPYWLYGSSGERTPWYPSMRLFRQPAPGDWDSVFARVRTELSEAVAAKRAGSWPPAPG